MLRAFLLAALPLPALAGVTEAVEGHVLPGVAAFAEACAFDLGPDPVHRAHADRVARTRLRDHYLRRLPRLRD